MAKTKVKNTDRDRDRGAPERPTPRNDAYVVMLLITFFAILAGCVLMYLDYSEYGVHGDKNPPKEVAPTPAKLGDGDGKVGEGKAPVR